MFSESINDTSGVVGIRIIGDATTWSVTYNRHSDNSRVIVYNRNLFSMQATGPEIWLWQSHRHQSNIDCLSFVMCPLLVPVLIGVFSSFFAVAVDSTNEANKAGGMRRSAVYNT